MRIMKSAWIGIALCVAVATASGQEKPYKEGQVIEVSYIKVKPGKFDEYMKFLGTTYKTLMEANKKAGLITGYSVFGSQARSPQDPDLILTVSYPNMAALDKSDEADAVAAKVVGSSDMQNKMAIDRESLREVMGSQYIRELILK